MLRFRATRTRGRDGARPGCAPAPAAARAGRCPAAAHEDARHLLALDLEPVHQLAWLAFRFDRIDLVEDEQLRHVGRADLLQHPLHFLDLLGMVRVGRVHHMQQQVGIDRFLQRGLEGGDQAVRQVADEADRVGKRDRTPRRTGGASGIRQVQLSGGRVERGEQLVGRIGAGLDQGVEQRRLAGIGIADDRDVEGLAALALAALRLALALDLDQAFARALDGIVDHPAVQFDLLFTRAAAHAGAAGLALQVRPAPHQAGAQVLQAGQLDLQLAFMAAGALARRSPGSAGCGR
jgi:hypothetical protein